jgi:hypothetical protein
MEIRFSIVVTLDTPTGKKSFGSFELGRERETAYKIFEALIGNIDSGSSRYICMELREEIVGLPVPLGILYCRLEELKENTAIITREIFKVHHLEK